MMLRAQRGHGVILGEVEDMEEAMIEGNAESP